MIQAMICTKSDDHPDADRLRVYTFETPDDRVTIVANLTNVYDVGDMAAIARIGSILPSEYGGGQPLTITERKVRGVLSQGMALGPTNAGLGDDISIAYGAEES